MNHQRQKIYPSKCSLKSFGVVSAYAANTHNGIARPYNEDRISIVLDMKKHHGTPKATPLQDKKVSFFAIFDGHGGTGCPEFLRDHLHQFVSSSEHFPQNPEQALRQGCL
jgi:protein phosphatase 2C family protein 2/3